MKVTWNMNGNWLLTASRDQSVKLYDIRIAREPLMMRGHTREVTSLAWHPVRRRVRSSSSSCSFVVVVVVVVVRRRLSSSLGSRARRWLTVATQPRSVALCIVRSSTPRADARAVRGTPLPAPRAPLRERRLRRRDALLARWRRGAAGERTVAAVTIVVVGVGVVVVDARSSSCSAPDVVGVAPRWRRRAWPRVFLFF